MNPSVIIATHRRARLLDATLASVAASTYPLGQMPIVVADNASDPDTRGEQAHATSQAAPEALQP